MSRDSRSDAAASAPARLEEVRLVNGAVTRTQLSHPLALSVLTRYESPVFFHGYEDKLYGYFWYAHGALQISKGKLTTAFGFLDCHATFSSGQELMGKRDFGVHARFLDAAGNLVERVTLSTRVDDPGFSSSGAEEAHVTARMNISVEARDSIASIQLIWDSDLDEIFFQLMGLKWGELKEYIPSFPVYPVPDFQKAGELLGKLVD